MNSVFLALLLLSGSNLASAWVSPQPQQGNIDTLRGSSVASDDMAIPSPKDDSPDEGRRNFFGQLGALTTATVVGCTVMVGTDSSASATLVRTTTATATTPRKWISTAEFATLLHQPQHAIDRVQFSGYQNTAVHVFLKNGTHVRLNDVIEAQQVANICVHYRIPSNYDSAQQELQDRQALAQEQNDLADAAVCTIVVAM
jgi:hypothetical protein